MGQIGFSYLDDSFVIGQTPEECRTAITVLVNMFEKLKFTINREKSVLELTQNLKFVRFDMNSIEITVSLTDEKCKKIKTTASQILDRQE